MNCSEFEIELEQLVETRTGTLTEQAATHATSCGSCQQRWHDHRLVNAAVLAWRSVNVPSSLGDSILSRLLAERTPLLRSSSSADTFRRWGVVAAAAACLLAVLGFGMVSDPRTSDRRVAQRETGVPLNSTGQSTIEVASSVAAVLDDLKTEYRELAAETRATAQEFAVVLPAGRVAPWIEMMSPEASAGTVEDSTNDRPGTVVSNAAPGAVSLIGQSIGTQIGQAMDFLWVAVPDSVPRG